MSFSFIVEQVNPEQYLIELWSCITKGGVIKNDNIWTLNNDDARWYGNFKSLIVRECYTNYSTQILGNSTQISRCLIKGLNGIGKTSYLNHLLVQIVEKHTRENDGEIPKIVLSFCDSNNQPVLILFDQDGARYIWHSNSSIANYFLSDSVDIALKADYKLQLEVASENPDNYKKFHDIISNDGDSSKKIMEPWSFEEITNYISIYNLQLSKLESEFLYDVFGGVVRYIVKSNENLTIVHDYVEECMEFYFLSYIKKLHNNTCN